MSEATQTAAINNLPIEFAEMSFDANFESEAAEMVQMQRNLEALDALKPTIIRYYELRKIVLEKLAKLSGTDSYFQSADGDVYKIVEAKGKFVSFDKYDYVRTKRDGEAKGTLSVKEAEAAGFTLPVKG